MPSPTEHLVRCYECKEKFTTNEGLKMHLMLFHLCWTPYECERCPEMRMPTVDSLKKHHKYNHPDWIRRKIIYCYDEEKESKLKEMFTHSIKVQSAAGKDVQTSDDDAVPFFLESTEPDLPAFPLPSVNKVKNNSEDSTTIISNEKTEQEMTDDEFAEISDSDESIDSTKVEPEIDTAVASSAPDLDLDLVLVGSALRVIHKRILKQQEEKSDHPQKPSLKRPKTNPPLHLGEDSAKPIEPQKTSKDVSKIAKTIMTDASESVATEEQKQCKAKKQKELQTTTSLQAKSGITNKDQPSVLNPKSPAKQARPEPDRSAWRQTTRFPRNQRGNVNKWWQGYEYTLHPQRRNVKTEPLVWVWRCRQTRGQRICRGRMETAPGGEGGEKVRTEHNHRADPHAMRVKLAMEDMREEAVTTQKSLSRIISDISAELTDEEIQRLPSHSSLSSTLGRDRRHAVKQ